MINNLSLPAEWSILMQYLEDAEIRNEIQTFPINLNKFNTESKTLIKEVAADLGVDFKKMQKISFSANFIHLYQSSKYLLYDPDYLFNRYRMITLRSALYEDFQPFDVQKVRNFCRTREKEALKSGLQEGVWHNREGDELFGLSEPAGDFSGNGSSGWKYIAFCNFIIDLYAKEYGFFFKRISPYDSLMKDSKIFPVSKPLKLRDMAFKPAIQKYIARLMSVDLPQG